MFPARAGMSREEARRFWEKVDVPRASGDEPWVDEMPESWLVCSPRERG